MTRAVRGIQAARNATAYICDQEGNHKGQGLLLDLGSEGSVVLTCHHVIAPVRETDLCVRLPRSDGHLGNPIKVHYDEERSRPDKDAVVLRLEDVQRDERPLLHKLDLDRYSGSLQATVLTHLVPNNFNAEVRPSTPLTIEAGIGVWPGAPERYELRAFRLSTPDDAREGISGGVILCEEGVLGLVHFARAEGAAHAREDYLIPLSTWAEGWPALAELIEPLIDKNLRAAAVVKPARRLEVDTDIVIAGFQPEVYVEREVKQQAAAVLEEHGGVVIVGRPKSGKTRLAWQLVQDRPEVIVVVPRKSQPPDTLEPSGLVGCNLIVLFDDLHSAADTMQPLLWRRRLEEASEQPCRIICTSRNGGDWKLVDSTQERLLETLGRDAILFASKTVERGQERGEDFSHVEGLQLAEDLGLTRAEFDRRFDGTPGSLLLDLHAMQRRYSGLNDEHRGGVSMSRLLDSAKLLHTAYQPSFDAPILRTVAEQIRGDGGMGDDTWDALKRRTQEEGFGQFDRSGNFRIYRPYLEECVAYSPSRREINKLVPILSEAEDAEGLFYLGTNYGRTLRDYAQSQVCLSRALELNPDSAVGWNNLAATLENLGCNEKALEVNEEALSRDSDRAEFWHNRGRILGNMRHHQEAAEAYERALALKPDFVEARVGISWVLGVIGQHEEALTAAETALNFNPNHPDALFNKGAALSNLGRHSEAVEYLCRAWRMWEHRPEKREQIASALESLGRTLADCE